MLTAILLTALGASSPPPPVVDVVEVPPQIELLTMGAGSFVWERWGHTALCVRYPRQPQRDLCFNYGSMDFRDPVGLFVGILRERPVFYVSAHPRLRLIGGYTHFDRDVWSQIIPLPENKARELESLLLENVRPENRHYVYHHFRENCATKPRDLIDDATGGGLRTDEPGHHSYRDFGRQGVAESMPLLFAMELLLGRGADDVASRWESAFLPIHLRDLVTDKLGVKPLRVYVRQGPPADTNPRFMGGWAIGLGLLFALPLAGAVLMRRLVRVALFVSAFAPAFLGLLLWVGLVFVTIDEVRFNELALVFVPFDFALPFLTRLRRSYLLGRFALIVLVMLLGLLGLFEQPFWVAFAMVAPFLVAAYATTLLPEVVEQRLDRAHVVSGEAHVDRAQTHEANGGDPNPSQAPQEEDPR